MSHLRETLAELLDESSGAAACREQHSFDELTALTSGIVLFGAGGLGRRLLRVLRENGIEPLGFVDNKLNGTIVEGVAVCTAQEAARKWGASAAFVVSIWSSWSDTFQEQSLYLRRLGCKTVLSFIPLLWKFPHLLPHVQVDLPTRVLEKKNDIQKAFELWNDEESSREFVAQLRWRLFGDFESLGRPVPGQYWQKDLFRLAKDTVYVDAGAFDGDTLEQFIRLAKGEFRHAYLFEPDERNLEAIRNRLRTLPSDLQHRIQVFDCAVAEGEYSAAFTEGLGASSVVGSGAEKVRCISLDNIVPEAPNIIKYDIEGFELRGIAGTRRIIAEDAPQLAVCAYHTQSHIWEIPLLVQSINPNYSFFLRPHGQIWETVCYAIPK